MDGKVSPHKTQFRLFNLRVMDTWSSPFNILTGQSLLSLMMAQSRPIIPMLYPTVNRMKFTIQPRASWQINGQAIFHTRWIFWQGKTKIQIVHFIRRLILLVLVSTATQQEAARRSNSAEQIRGA